jgi:hypothetical protein
MLGGFQRFGRFSSIGETTNLPLNRRITRHYDADYTIADVVSVLRRWVIAIFEQVVVPPRGSWNQRLPAPTNTLVSVWSLR